MAEPHGEGLRRQERWSKALRSGPLAQRAKEVSVADVRFAKVVIADQVANIWSCRVNREGRIRHEAQESKVISAHPIVEIQLHPAAVCRGRESDEL